MKRIVLFLFFITLIGFVVASSTGTMHVNVQVSALRVGISVPNEVNFTDITCGYWQKEQIIINNTGTVDINVTPSLDPSYSGTLLENLGFSTKSPGTGTTPSSGSKIGEFNFQLEKPDTYGGERSKSIYVYLDLTNYTNCSTSQINDSVDVIFTAVEA